MKIISLFFLALCLSLHARERSVNFEAESANVATAPSGTNTKSIKITTESSRPNILLFIVDDMGANDTSEPFQVDASGNDVPSTPNSIYITPNMELLAKQGMKFTRAYAMPVCSPTRVSYMTGQNSVRHHVTNWTSPYFNIETGQNSTPSHNSPLHWRRSGLDPSSNTLPKLLRNAGYRSIQVLIHFPHDHNGSDGDYYTVFHEGDYKLIYNVITDISETTNLAASDPKRVMAMARKMEQELKAKGAQWPTFDTSPTDTEDPFTIPSCSADTDCSTTIDNTGNPSAHGQ